MNWAKLREIGVRSLLVIFAGLTGLFQCFCCLGCGTHPVVLDLITFPWTETLVEDYLEAVAAGDLDTAVDLGCPSESCREQLRKVAERDIALLNGTEIRNIDVDIGVNMYSDESVVVAYVDFEYRLSDDPEWKEGKRTCWSDYSLFGKRYLSTCSLEQIRPH